jgi:threonine dehydratase
LTQPDTLVARDRIMEVERTIRLFIRRTPVLCTDASEFGLASDPLWLKLELLQHSGSFKARGVVKSPTGYPIQSPYVSIANRQTEIMMKIATEFGFTPASRSRISAPLTTQPDLFECASSEGNEA